MGISNSRKSAVKNKYLEITEEVNALDFLEKAYFFISQNKIKTINWKWISIALHGALYGFAICMLKGTNYERVINESNNRLISFDEAIKRCQRPKYVKMTTISKELVLNHKQRESIRILKDLLRNNFIHYIPSNWSIEIHGCPNVAIDILSIIKFLALKSGNYLSLSDAQKKKVEFYTDNGILILKNNKLYKESVSE
ncbi:MAG: hypothetical protein PHG03_05440 [Bacilli bacterium]|nr:hypothetical protein [Bacilli bacterium]